MIVRKSSERGQGKFGWLNAKYTFSFSRYYDPKWMGHGPLLVINQDKVDPGMGFPPHSHDNMEIMTYILEGSLQHKDSFGNEAVIRPGEVQIISAGKGITHSEMNPDKSKEVHLLQIWVHTDTKDLNPTYQQKDFSHNIDNGLTLVASKDEESGSLKINQNMRIYAGKIQKGVDIPLKKGWVQLISGSLKADNQILSEGDGAALTQSVVFKVDSDAHVLYFEFLE